MELGFMLLRLAVGLTLAAHGSQKLFGWFGGPGLAGTGSFLEQLGFRPGRTQATLAGTAELGGGLLLAAGLFTPFAAAAIVSVMFVAVASVHWTKGFFAQNGGFELPFLIASSAVAIAVTGPGAISLDALMGTALSGALWGAAALLGGLLMGSVPLLRRKQEAVSAQKAA